MIAELESLAGSGKACQVCRMYYETNGWRGHGQPRFFANPEAPACSFWRHAGQQGVKKPRGSKAGQGGTKAARKKAGAASRVKKVA